MLFELNGTKFMVKFSHSQPCTYAELWQYKDDLGDYDCLNIMGIAECSVKDTFKKAIGRKVALAKLLERMNIFAEEDNNPVLRNTKEQRLLEIWNVYFKDHKKE